MKMLNMELTKELQFSTKFCLEEEKSHAFCSEWSISRAPLGKDSTCVTNTETL